MLTGAAARRASRGRGRPGPRLPARSVTPRPGLAARVARGAWVALVAWVALAACRSPGAAVAGGAPGPGAAGRDDARRDRGARPDSSADRVRVIVRARVPEGAPDSAAAAAATARLAAHLREEYAAVVERTLSLIPAVVATVDAAVVPRLRADTLVAYVTPDRPSAPLRTGPPSHP